MAPAGGEQGSAVDIGKGLEHLAAMFALIVLGSVVATLCLVALALCLIALGARLLRRMRRPGPPGAGAVAGPEAEVAGAEPDRGGEHGARAPRDAGGRA